jgi:hypothetical protein
VRLFCLSSSSSFFAVARGMRSSAVRDVAPTLHAAVADCQPVTIIATLASVLLLPPTLLLPPPLLLLLLLLLLLILPLLRRARTRPCRGHRRTGGRAPTASCIHWRPTFQ